MNRSFLTASIAVACICVGLPAAGQTYNESFSAAIVEVPAVTRSKGRLATTPAAMAPGSATGFGFSFGSTYEMQECNRRAYAATLMGMGQNAAALALICNNAEVQASLNLAGIACPQQRQQPAAAYASSSASPGASKAPAGLPAFCRDRRTYSAQLCLGAAAPR